jgi:hypothetical protein
MRNYAARFELFLIVTAILACFFSSSVRAPGQEVSTGSAGSKPVPTEKLGTGLYSTLPFKVTFSLRGGYDDNVTTFNVVKQGSGYTTGTVALTYDFGSPRTHLSLEAGAGLTYFWEHIQNVGIDNNDYDINTHLRLSLTHKATARLTLSIHDYLTYQTEPDFTLMQGLNRRVGNFFHGQNHFGASYLWTPRFSTVTSYNLTALIYDDSAVGQFEDRFENTFGNEFRYLIWPKTTVVGEYRFQFTSYVHETSRDSTSQFYLAGFEHSFDPRVSSSFRGGVQFREYELGGGRTSPYFEGSLTYVVGKQTRIAWTNRYSIEEADTAANRGRETFRTGLNAKHDFTPRISGSIGAYYEHHDYQGFTFPGATDSGSTEESIDMALSLRYAVTRYFGVEAGYNYTDVSSDIPFRDYSRNRYWAGLNVTF